MDFKSLLLVYKEKIRERESIFLKISVIIKQETGLEIKESNLKLKEGIVFIKIKPAQKLLIILNKDKILDHFKGVGLKVIDLK